MDSRDSTGRRQFLKAAVSATALTAADASLASTSELVATGQASMPKRVLGKTGEQVPILQLGTSQDLDPRYDKVMHKCFKEGVTWFDTALSYGWGASHRAVANFVRQVGERKGLWLTSKSGESSVAGLERAADKALLELETDYLDLYLMHGINNEDMLDPQFLRLGERLKKSGKIKYFGFSCHSGNVVGLLDKAAKVGGVDAILFRYNFRRYGERDLNLAIDACHKAGIGLLAMKTMGSVPAELESVVDFKSKDFSLAQAKLKSVWADERISSVVSEMDNIQVTRENVAAAKTERVLTASEAHQLNQLAALTAQYSCNGCSHLCEQAAGGNIAIADSLRFLMYHECYGKQARAKELFAQLSTTSQEWERGALERASSVCPQGIDIPVAMARARALLA